MSVEAWLEFLSRSSPKLHRAGRVPNDLAEILNATTTIVHIGRPYVNKLLTKHGLEPDHLPLMDIAFHCGYVYCDRDRHLTFIYQDEAFSGKTYKIAIKANADGSEMLVCSFFKVRPTEASRLLKLNDLIRQHK